MCSSSQQHANNSTVFIAKAPIPSITISVESVSNVDIMQDSSLPTKRAYQPMILQPPSPLQSPANLSKCLHSNRMSQKVQFRLYSTELLCCNRFFGGDPCPPYLRRTEEPPFIRTVYQLWGLCLLDPEGRKLRLKSLKLKDLVTIKEFAWTYRNEEMNIILPILKINPDKQGLRPIVNDLVFEMEPVAERAWDCDPEYFFGYSTGWLPEVPLGIADDIHNKVRDIVAIGRYLPGKRLVPAKELWDDTSDGEIMD